MLIKEIALRNYPYRSRRGLSERLAKKYLEKNGFEVFAGSSIVMRSFNYFLFPNVRKKHDRLEQILKNKLGINLVFFRNLLTITKGIPDYFAYRNTDHKMFFAEVKLGHEQIKNHQYWCMSLIEAYGFEVVVLRLKRNIYRKKSIIDLQGDIEKNKRLRNRKILEKQEKIRVNYS